MRKLYNKSKTTIVYFTPTHHLFDFQKELYRYEYIKLLKKKFNKCDAILYWSLILSDDDCDPFLKVSNEKIFNMLELSLVDLEKYNNDINTFIATNVPLFNCTVNDIIVSFTDNVCHLKLDFLKKEYTILRSKYNEKYKGEIFSCFLRYDSLNFLSPISAAVKPEIYNYLHKEYKCNIELFGSLFNSRLKYYFGLFYDLEKNFGCLGNFLKSRLKSGFFVANPPYEILMMNMFFTKVKDELKNNNIKIYTTLPAWDNKDRERLNKNCKNDKKLRTDYDNNYQIHLLDKYVILNHLFCKSNYNFYDYLQQRNINFAPVHVLLLSHDKSFIINTEKIHSNYIQNYL